MKISEVIKKYPTTIEIMVNYGLHCVGCGMSAYESIEEGAEVHGLTKNDINEMVGKMNEIVE